MNTVFSRFVFICLYFGNQKAISQNKSITDMVTLSYELWKWKLLSKYILSPTIQITVPLKQVRGGTEGKFHFLHQIWWVLCLREGKWKSPLVLAKPWPTSFLQYQVKRFATEQAPAKTRKSSLHDCLPNGSTVCLRIMNALYTKMLH